VKKRFAQILVCVLTVVLLSGIVVPVAGAAERLSTPEVRLNHNYRSLIFTPDAEASSYTLYVFATFADAQAGENAIARAVDVQPTIGSTAAGGTTQTPAQQLDDGEVLIDVRLVQFEATAGNAAVVRTLPASYTPAGIGDSWYPGDGQGDTTNLRPGQYWFRLQAIGAQPAQNSLLSEVALISEEEPGHTNPFSISMGPDEGRALLEELRATRPNDFGTTSAHTVRLIDLRPETERAEEGHPRFFEAGNRMTNQDMGGPTVNQPHLIWDDDALEGIVDIFGPDKDAYIWVL